MMIDDLITDFLADEKIESETDNLKKLLTYAFDQYGLQEIDEENQYAVLRFILCRLLNHDEDLSELDYNSMKSICDETMSEPIEDILEYIEAFKWLPPAMKKVYSLGQKLFEMAQTAYYGLDEADDKFISEAEDLLKTIHECRDELETENYKYRSKSDVESLYEVELSECELDVGTVKGNDIILSFRMGDFVEEMDESSILNQNNDDLFNLRDPFTIPENLFGGNPEDKR